jgi:diadenosine tetraphosphate (Ap4A) HIT family hydrolase
VTFSSCPLCDGDGGLLLHRCDLYRVVRVTDTPAHPVFYRVIVNAHVAEFSALAPTERLALMDAVVAVEQVLLQHVTPTKVNLASLGNVVPHLHWHVIARFADDAQFPAPIWAPAERSTAPEQLQRRMAMLPAVDAALQAALARLG